MRLPSVFHSGPAQQDLITTAADIEAAAKLGKVTSPEQTAVFICALSACNRLFPTRERLMLHRKRDHTDVEPSDERDILTWNS